MKGATALGARCDRGSDSGKSGLLSFPLAASSTNQLARWPLGRRQIPTPVQAIRALPHWQTGHVPGRRRRQASTGRCDDNIGGSVTRHRACSHIVSYRAKKPHGWPLCYSLLVIRRGSTREPQNPMLSASLEYLSRRRRTEWRVEALLDPTSSPHLRATASSLG
jgi:hypothetical protein